MSLAFVNFIQVEDLLYFAKTKLGVKWFVHSFTLSAVIVCLFEGVELYLTCRLRNMFSSEKVLQMSYANYQ